MYVFTFFSLEGDYNVSGYLMFVWSKINILVTEYKELVFNVINNTCMVWDYFYSNEILFENMFLFYSKNFMKL